MSRKVKYDLAFKLRCVKDVLEKHQSIVRVSDSVGINEVLLRKWLQDYEIGGSKGLGPKVSNRTYSSSFKLNVLKAIENENLSLKDARLRFRIPSDSTIITWQRNFATFGVNGLESKPKGRPITMNRKPKAPLTRLEELELENERLRCENAFLKKLRALIQAEEEQRRGLSQKPYKN
jgi:transposase